MEREGVREKEKEERVKGIILRRVNSFERSKDIGLYYINRDTKIRG